MFREIAILALGILPGWLLRGNTRVVDAVGRLTTGVIYVLLFVLGIRLGADQSLPGALRTLGGQGLVIGFCCTLGSACGGMALSRLFRSRKGMETGTAQRGGIWRSMRGALKILACFCAGIIPGITGILPEWIYGGDVFLVVLWAMLACVGMCLGFCLKAFRLVGEMGPRVLLLPLLTIGGTVLGAAASCFLTALDFRSCLAAGAGMGYYSLSTVIVSELAAPALASVTLTANVFRELLVLLSAPLMVRLMGPLAPVAGSGATGVDVCLPVIMRFSGEHYAFLAVFNGLVMTILVPFMVPLVLTLGR